MKKISILMLIISCIFLLFSACSEDSKSDAPQNPCMCLINYSNTTAYGIAYRPISSSQWSIKPFDDPVYTSGDGVNCREGVMDSVAPSGNYEIRVYGSGGYSSPIWTWNNVPYNGGNIGFYLSTTSSTSLYGSVDSNCQSNSTQYHASY